MIICYQLFALPDTGSETYIYLFLFNINHDAPPLPRVRYFLAKEPEGAVFVVGTHNLGFVTTGWQNHTPWLCTYVASADGF